jgi:hypothetical protein
MEKKDVLPILLMLEGWYDYRLSERRIEKVLRLMRAYQQALRRRLDTPPSAS